MIQDKIVSVKYLLPDASDSDKESYVANAALSNVKINIQPAGDQTIAIVGGVLGQTYTAFTTRSGISEGNYLTVSGTTNVFIVRGVTDWSTPNLIPHYELLLDKVKENGNQ